MLREIVVIDEERCDGCGLCVPACHEGALRIIDGKARLVSDRLCDGLGACLGDCPRGAIRIERREAADFDAAAAREAPRRTVAAGSERSPDAIAAGSERREAGGSRLPHSPGEPAVAAGFSGCPGSRMAQWSVPAPAAARPGGGYLPAAGAESAAASPACPGGGYPPAAGAESALASPAGNGQEANSQLTHWPVQLRLVSPLAPVFRGAKLLVAADCVPVAYGGFQDDLLRDRAVVIACPKLDDPEGYVEKLAEIMARHDLQEITVAHMEVPCCTGLLRLVLGARELANSDAPVHSVVIGTHGEVRSRTALPARGGCPAAGTPPLHLGQGP